MKNLANCKPSEFLKQTNRIRKSVEKWLNVTDVMSIRRRKPEGMPEVQAGMSQDEVDAIREKQRQMMAEQSQRNLKDMLDSMLDNHPEETLEVLALCCFVEPENVDEHTVSEYLLSINELLADEAVRDFFTFLMQLAQ
jgi:hypothetical protein